MADVICLQLGAKVAHFDRRIYDGLQLGNVSAEMLRAYLSDLSLGRQPDPGLGIELRLKSERTSNWTMAQICGVAVWEFDSAVDLYGPAVRGFLDDLKPSIPRLLGEFDQAGNIQGRVYDARTSSIRYFREGTAFGRDWLCKLRIKDLLIPGVGRPDEITYLHAYDPKEGVARVLAWDGKNLREMTWPAEGDAAYLAFAQALSRGIDEYPPLEGRFAGCGLADYERMVREITSGLNSRLV